MAVLGCGYRHFEYLDSFIYVFFQKLENIKHFTQWPRIFFTHTLSVYKSALKSADHFFESHFRSFSHFVTGSLGHPVTLSLCHSVTYSLCHSVTRSLGHSITWSLGYSVTRSLGHFWSLPSLIFLLVIPEWPADIGETEVTSDRMIEWPSDQK